MYDFIEKFKSERQAILDNENLSATGKQNKLTEFDKRGNPDWDEIKTQAPELFGAGTANANAGAGTNKDIKPKQNNMNAFIRGSTGRKR